MAKVIMTTPPGAAYEYAEVQGGTSMSHAEIAALLDEYVEKHGLYPVETVYDGESPRHKYGRYKPTQTATEQPAAPSNDEIASMRSEIEELKALLTAATEPLDAKADPDADEKAKKA
ncbi:hypothetical protein SAMN02927924_01429 [Sphingobium faniae]|nr:hypothetical protein SAMN02927924_01429 [Sphingobium faniae]